MKNYIAVTFLFFNFFITELALAKSPNLPPEKVVTREDDAFTFEKLEPFTAVYVDKFNGLKWGNRLPGHYSNGARTRGAFDAKKCTYVENYIGATVKVEDSEAAMACKSIGARLPTKEEYFSLIENFRHEYVGSSPALTGVGRKQMADVFQDISLVDEGIKTDRQWFWTSSTIANNPCYGYEFSVYYGAVDHYYRDYHIRAGHQIYVRCVQD